MAAAVRRRLLFALMPPIKSTANPDRAAAEPLVNSPRWARTSGTMTQGSSAAGMMYDVSWIWASRSGEHA